MRAEVGDYVDLVAVSNAQRAALGSVGRPAPDDSPGSASEPRAAVGSANSTEPTMAARQLRSTTDAMFSAGLFVIGRSASSGQAGGEIHQKNDRFKKFEEQHVVGSLWVGPRGAVCGRPQTSHGLQKRSSYRT